jgi:hypothetical protein
MTPEQETEFKTFGCACRCLLALARQKGSQVTVADFIDQYKEKYPVWTKFSRTGVTDTAAILDIARDFDLARGFTIYISQDEVRKRAKESTISNLLFFTEKVRDDKDGSYSDFFHCRLIIPEQSKELKGQLPEDYFPVIEVDENLNTLEPLKVLNEEVRLLNGYFLLLY